MYRVNAGSSPASQRRSSPGSTSSTTREPQTPDALLAETSAAQDAPATESLETLEVRSESECGQALREVYEHGSIRDIFLAELEQKKRRNAGQDGSPQESATTDPSTTAKEPATEKDRRTREKLAEKKGKKNEKAREKAMMKDNAKSREKKLKSRALEAKAREREAKHLKKAAEKDKIQEEKSRRKLVAESNRLRNDSPIAFFGDVSSPPTKEEKKAAKASASKKRND
jgi:hypothetical protein